MYVQAHDDGKERVQIVILLAANLNKNKEREREKEMSSSQIHFFAQKKELGKDYNIKSGSKLKTF